MCEQLFTKLEHTEYGETLLANPRWSKYIPEWMNVGEWEIVLGPDVNNYRHMGYMADLTRSYIEESARLGAPFSKEDAELLVDVAYTHDFAEAIDGDIADPDKRFDKKTFEQERKSMIQVLGAVAVDYEAIQVASRVLPVMQGRSELSHVWRAIELMGYVDTARKARYQLDNFEELKSQLLLSPDRWDSLKTNLEALAEDVQERTVPQLRKFDFMPAVKEFLDGESA